MARVRKAKVSKSRTRSEVEQLRARLAEAEETLSAIRGGEVDAIAVDGPHGRQIYTLHGPDQPYRLFAESMSEGAASMTAEGTIIFCNKRLADLVGQPVEKLIGSTAGHLVPESVKDRFQKLLVRGFEGRAQEELQFHHKDGRLVPVLVSVKAFSAETGRGLSLVATDLSEFKRIDSEKDKAQELGRRLAAIVESSDDAITAKTLDGEITSWNRGAERLYGYTAAEAIGQSVKLIVPQELHQELADSLKRLRNAERIEHHDTVRLCKDGRRVHVSVTISPLRNAMGEISGASTIARDITERKRAEQKLQRLNRTLRALGDCTEALMRASDEASMLQQVCDVVVGTAGYRMAWVGYAEHDQNKTVRPVAVAGLEEGYLKSVQVSWDDVERGRGPTGTAIRTASTVVCRDLAGDPRLAPWREEALRRGYRSSLAIPLKIERVVFAVLTIYAADAGEFDAEEQRVVEELATDVTYAIMTLRARAASEQAARDLRKASRYTRTLIEASLDPLVTISREGKISDVNLATEKVTGVPRGQLMGSDFSNYFSEPDRARQGYEQVFATGAVRDYPLAIRHTSGSLTDVVYNATVFRNEMGEVEGVFAAARDVTARKQAEAAILKLNRELEDRVQQRTAQLQESERRVRKKLDSILSPEGDLGSLEITDLLDIPGMQALAEDFYKLARIPMFIVDLKGNPVVAAGWQEACTRFHRVHPDSCKNCTESDQLLSQDVAPGTFKLYQCKNHMWDVVTPIVVGKQRVGNLFSGQFFFSDEPLDYDVFRSQAARFGFDEKEYVAALERAPRLSREAVETGMTFFAKFAQLLSQLSYSSVQLARSMEQTRRINEDLAANVKELEAFTYSVSHDLRAPLRHISGFSKILMEEFGSTLPLEAQHHVQRIEEGTLRMGRLVDDLLNLARVGRRELASQVTGLRSLVDEVIAELKPESEGRTIEWKIGKLPYVECDPGLMKQVFQNLISNAVKFTRPRSEAVIEIGQQEKDGATVIFVGDNGVGFSMKYSDKLFGVFQRLHRVEDFEGTGVGLATVLRIIQKHGGRIWAEAELDKGATFYFSLGHSEGVKLNAKGVATGEQA